MTLETNGANVRPKVYISGPLTSSGNVLENVEVAIVAARRLIEAGFSPMVPHLSYHIDPVEMYPHETWMEVDLPWLEAADAVLRLPGESVGADIEARHAQYHRIPVFDSMADLVEHFAGQAGSETANVAAVAVAEASPILSGGLAGLETRPGRQEAAQGP